MTAGCPFSAGPRKASTTGVIGAALRASAHGIGYRRIATSLNRPLSKVRRWICTGRDPQHVQWLRAQAVDWLARVDRDVLAVLTPQPTRLGEALTALAAAALTLRARVAPHVRDCASNGVSGLTRRAAVRRDGHCE